MKLQTFVLTRFNLRMMQGSNRWVGADIDYLLRRFSLFEKYCLPSIAKQSVKQFVWIVLFSDATPMSVRERIEGYRAMVPQFTPVFVDDIDGFDTSDMSFVDIAMRRYAEADSTHYLTIRIDNDDAFSVDAVQEYIDVALENLSQYTEERFFLIFPHGAQYLEKDRTTCRYVYDSNHFTGLLQRKEERGHVLNFDHSKIRESGVPVVESHYPYMWLEVVHGSNLMNSYRIVAKPVNVSRDWMFERFAVKTENSVFDWCFYWLKYLRLVLCWRIKSAMKKFNLL